MNWVNFGLFGQQIQEFKIEEMEVGGGGVPLVFVVIYFALIVVVIAGLWKVFTKAGEAGWACLVPIYNLVVMMRIVGMPLWWILVMFIPFVGLIPAFMLPVKLADCFGKGIGFALGLIFLPMIFYPILGFGDARYSPPPMQR